MTHVAFKDAAGIRRTLPIAHTGVHEDEGPHGCTVTYVNQIYPVPMSYGAFRRLMGLDAPPKPIEHSYASVDERFTPPAPRA